MNTDIKTGTVEGTGAAINIECGFQPKAVTILNIDGLARLDWVYGMGNGYGLKQITAGTISKITSNGISLYSGGTPPISLTGTSTVAAGSSSIAGSSSAYLTELKVGDEVKLGNEIRTVKEVVSDTLFVVTSAFDVAHSGVTATLEGKRADGFTIGADTDVNVSAETLMYIARR